MESGGMAHLGIGIGKGEKAMADAAQNAISSPMLETSIDGARAVLINVTCNSNCSIVVINDAVEMITAAADSEANIIFGASIDDALEDEVHITVIATGFEKVPFPPRASSIDRPATLPLSGALRAAELYAELSAADHAERDAERRLYPL